MRGILVLSLSAVGVGLLGLSTFNFDPKLLYNPTPSAPIGWYKIVPSDTYLPGDLVASWLPEDAEKLAQNRGYLPQGTPVIKTVLAAPGDEYCIKEGRLWVADTPALFILPTDSQDRVMPVLPDGCRSLMPSEYLVVSDRVSKSFDSRYFGPVDEDLILGKAEYVGVVEESVGRYSREQGGARGTGAQGKIKGRSTNLLLSPCLHIDFYSTNSKQVVLPKRHACREYWGFGQYQFSIFPNHSRMSQP
tara:strand:- start:4970 stop:5710 length:741 start_codon:yes stop_codon:yes gene_type:complete